MKCLVSVGALLVSCLAAAPAFAHVVEVTTSIDLQEASDPDRVHGAVKSAVADVLDRTIAFTPTLVTVTSARVIGERVYFRLLIVDAEGEEALRNIHSEPDEAAENRDLVI